MYSLGTYYCSPGAVPNCPYTFGTWPKGQFLPSFLVSVDLNTLFPSS